MSHDGTRERKQIGEEGEHVCFERSERAINPPHCGRRQRKGDVTMRSNSSSKADVGGTSTGSSHNVSDIAVNQRLYLACREPTLIAL